MNEPLQLQNISSANLIQRMTQLVRTERKITHLILLHIVEIEARKLYAELGFDSMYSYLTKGLGYSESASYRRIQSARLLKAMPEVAVKLEDGSLNLSQLTQIQKCLKEESKNGRPTSPTKTQEILSQIEHKNSFETEKVLALEFNKPIQRHESIKPQRDESIRLELTFTKEQFTELEHAKNLLSHVCHDNAWAEVMTVLARKYIQSKLGKPTATQSFAATEDALDANSQKEIVMKARMEKSATKNGHRIYFSRRIKKSLLNSAKNCCEYKTSNGKTCGSTYQLQIDHRQPLALGGSNNIDNLRMLCRTHV